MDENKQNIDKMPGEKSDIYGKPTRFLQKKAALWRQFTGSMQFFSGFFAHYSLQIRCRRAVPHRETDLVTPRVARRHPQSAGRTRSQGGPPRLAALACSSKKCRYSRRERPAPAAPGTARGVAVPAMTAHRRDARAIASGTPTLRNSSAHRSDWTNSFTLMSRKKKGCCNSTPC